MILAGGLGTRLRGVVSDVPKPMAPVRGRPFLEHQMDYWIGQGVGCFVLAVGYKHAVISGHFGERYRDIPVSYAVETEPLGTGGGLLLASKGLAEPFLVLNGDTFFEVDLRDLRTFHEAHRSSWTFTLFRSDDTGRYMGMEVDPGGRVVRLKSESGVSGGLANGGVYMVDPSALRAATSFAGRRVSLEDEVLPAIQGAGCTLYGMQCTGRFIDIGIPEDYRRAGDVLPV